MMCAQGALTWTEPVLGGAVPSARRGACAACTQNRFVVVFGGKSVDADSKESLAEDLLLLEMEGPSTIKVSSLTMKGNKPAPRVNATLQVSRQACVTFQAVLPVIRGSLSSKSALKLHARLSWGCVLR